MKVVAIPFHEIESAKTAIDVRYAAIEIDLKPIGLNNHPFAFVDDPSIFSNETSKNRIYAILDELKAMFENIKPRFKSKTQILQKFLWNFVLLILFFGVFGIIVILQEIYQNYKRLGDFWTVIYLIVWLIIFNLLYMVWVKFRYILKKRKKKYDSIIEKFCEKENKEAKGYRVSFKEKTILRKRTKLDFFLKFSIRKISYLEFLPIRANEELESAFNMNRSSGVEQMSPDQLKNMISSEAEGLTEIDKIIKEIDNVIENNENLP